MLLIAAANDTSNDHAAFFGFMGIAAALVFSSILRSPRPRRSLRNCKSRTRNMLHFCPKTRPYHQVRHTSRAGRYLGSLRTHRISYHPRINGQGELPILQGLLPSRCRSLLWFLELGCRTCHRYCGWCRYSSIDTGIRANSQQERLFTGMMLILIFAEALGLYGFIVALIISSKN